MAGMASVEINADKHKFFIILSVGRWIGIQRLGAVDVHRIWMMAAAIEMKALKLWSVLHERIANDAVNAGLLLGLEKIDCADSGTHTPLGRNAVEDRALGAVVWVNESAKGNRRLPV